MIPIKLTLSFKIFHKSKMIPIKLTLKLIIKFWRVLDYIGYKEKQVSGTWNKCVLICKKTNSLENINVNCLFVSRLSVVFIYMECTIIYTFQLILSRYFNEICSENSMFPTMF